MIYFVTESELAFQSLHDGNKKRLQNIKGYSYGSPDDAEGDLVGCTSCDTGRIREQAFLAYQMKGVHERKDKIMGVARLLAFEVHAQCWWHRLWGGGFCDMPCRDFRHRIKDAWRASASLVPQSQETSPRFQGTR